MNRSLIDFLFFDHSPKLSSSCTGNGGDKHGPGKFMRIAFIGYTVLVGIPAGTVSKVDQIADPVIVAVGKTGDQQFSITLRSVGSGATDPDQVFVILFHLEGQG